MDIPFPPGAPSPTHGPLARFLPPLEEGAVTRLLETLGGSGDLVFDPFGASPRLVIEAARAGRAVVVAANNPVNRFLLIHTARPFTIADLQAATARLASAVKDGQRLETFLLDLYATECSRCGGEATADYFVWEREAEGPILKAYACPHCNHAGEDPTTEADWNRAREHGRPGLQHARALEQVAPAGDPDRQHAEAALSVYPGRAVNALITLAGKLEQLTLPPRLRAAAQAILLSTFDAANALWGHPEGRARPLQLIASPRYREANVWRAFERVAVEWVGTGPEVPVEEWQKGGAAAPGTVLVFPGPARDVISEIPAHAIRAVLTVLPRPNQSFWTLSALWAAWLWGRAAAAPIKVALRRRRYDWGWHAGALRASMAGVAGGLSPSTPVCAFMPEAEAGFLAAAMAGFDGVGLALTGCAVRAAEGQAVVAWRAEAPRSPEQSIAAPQERMTRAAAEILRRRGEPSPYLTVYAAAWSELARERALATLWQAEEGNPLGLLSETAEAALSDARVLIRMGAGTELEHGLYWLADAAGAATPLADRVEEYVLGALRETGEVDELELDGRLCNLLPGLLTPDRRLIQACLRSYAEREEPSRIWRLREEDQAGTRAGDCAEIRMLLEELGTRLGYGVDGEDPLLWRDESGRTEYAFRVRETAALGRALSETAAQEPVHFALPGGRASLVAEMARRDPRLRDWLGARARVLKFRHIRRLASETTLRRENLAERLVIDPPEHRDPQLPLL